jgi:para-aminobenzoate synthetase/4-amino-4-deoxychorismate lyase
MTSTVSGELRPEVGFQQIFRALFPCGSITGAPKVRAMQLLAELEPQPRGVYTGSIGFFSPRKAVFNVAIRTVQLDGNRATMGVGSGIVIDSDPASEYRECLLKAEFLTHPPNSLPDRFSLVETLLWDGQYPLIELHLDRLEDSANYFGFPCDRAEVKAALLAHALGFPVPQPAPLAKDVGSESGVTNRAGAPSIPHLFAEWVGEHRASLAAVRRKVRLRLDRDGQLHISSEPLPDTVANPAPIRVRIATERTDPQDRMLFHKTTHRPLYAQAFEAASQLGFADAVFLNLRGEVTEGAIHNLFVEKSGRWLTPPIDCGLLAGVYRRHMLETYLNAQDALLTLDDLHQADAVYLCNAVRGLRRATIDW